MELRRAPRAAEIAPPFIVVGASLGGPYVRIFADIYPDDVEAIVLVDPTPDSDLKAWPDTLEQARASRVPAGVPVLLIDAIAPREIPLATRAVRTLRMSRLANWDGESLEYKQWLETIPDGRLIVADSGHNVPQERPEIVIATIREAVRRN